MASNFKISGFLEVDKALEALPKEFSRTRKRNIAKKGMGAFLSRAKQKARVRSGALEESISTKTFRNNPNWVFGGVTTKKTIKSVVNDKIVVDGFYAKFIEYGYRQVAWPTKGTTIKLGTIKNSQIKEIEPRPFLRPAYDETKEKVRKDTINLVIKRLRSYQKKFKAKN